MLEKRLVAVPPQSFTADGGADGIITIADTRPFKVKQEVILTANTLPNLDDVEVKRVISPTQLAVGPKKGNIDTRTDVSAYTVALSGAISANEQKRPSIPLEESTRAVYEEEPTVAWRSMLVDKFGREYRPDNPFPVQLSDGSINIGTVNAELEVQLSHKDDYLHPGDIHDSVRIGDGVTEVKVDPQNQSLSTNRYEKLLALLANANWMKLADFDAIVPVFAGDVATLEYKQNGAIIGRAICTFVTDSDWDIVLQRYINDDDGSILLDDDGSYLFLD